MTTTTDHPSSQGIRDTQDDTAAGEQLSLAELIRDVAATAADDATPMQIAQALIDKFGDELRGPLLLGLVTDAVRDRLGSQRRTALSSQPPSNGSSNKLIRRRDWWAGVLTTRVPTADGSWKRLGQCTIEDLQHCIADREELIKRTRMQIAHYEQLIQAMTTHGAAKVSDLRPEQVGSL